jgi:hypothetical protein
MARDDAERHLIIAQTMAEKFAAVIKAEKLDHNTAMMALALTLAELMDNYINAVWPTDESETRRETPPT